jgi:hypothetical protein
VHPGTVRNSTFGNCEGTLTDIGEEEYADAKLKRDSADLIKYVGRKNRQTRGIRARGVEPRRAAGFELSATDTRSCGAPSTAPDIVRALSAEQQAESQAVFNGAYRVTSVL